MEKINQRKLKRNIRKVIKQFETLLEDLKLIVKLVDEEVVNIYKL